MDAHLTAATIADKVNSGELDPVSVTEDALARVAARDGELGAFLTVSGDSARKAAARAAGPLAGVPVAVKDNLCWPNAPTTCASRMLENFRPPYTAAAVERLEQAGAVILGKTNLDEFGMGNTTENSALGRTRNPWDLARVPGGSSGGSAAAVAAGFCPLALGSDTGGSVRQPASHCGVIGFKPTYGAVSRYGLVAYASSLDHVGFFTRTAEDAARALRILAQPDLRDATCLRAPLAIPDEFPNDLAGLKIGLPEEYFNSGGLAPEVKNAVLGAVEKMKCAGAEVKNIALPLLKYAVPAYYVIADAEAGSNLARYDGAHFTARAPGRDIREMTEKTRSRFFGEEVKKRIMLGTYVLSAGYYDAYYLRALKVRRLIAEEFARAFREVDCIAAPAAPDTAGRIGEEPPSPLARYLSDIYTVSANLAGIPAISVPCGADGDGMPIGIQLMAGHLQDGRLLTAAKVLENLTGWRNRTAPGF